jgi:hypothetical protein
MTSDAASPPSCAGWCRDCGCEHALPEGDTRRHAHAIIREFEQIGRLDHLAAERSADPRLSFDHLHAAGRGHMVGVLECRDARGNTVVLRAFSSLRDGIRSVAGWVPPILSDADFYDIVEPAQRDLDRLNREIEALPPDSAAHRESSRLRRDRSQALLERMRGLYRFSNFRDETRGLHEALCRSISIPGVIGECCAPKLLNHAARNGLRPIGLCEFYWGTPNKSGTRRPGEFYPCCKTRCEPILGFMLCGCEDAG